MLKILLCLFLLYGCAFQPKNEPESPYPEDFNWEEVSFDWITEKEIPFTIGRIVSGGISGYLPFQFQSENGEYSFYYTDWMNRFYNAYGRWDENTIYFDYPDVLITYTDNNSDKTAVLSLNASVDPDGITSNCLLTLDEQVLNSSIQMNTGDYLLVDVATNELVHLENDELWLFSYSYLLDFYDLIIRQEKVISGTKSTLWQMQGVEIAEDMTLKEDTIHFSDEFWKRNPLSWSAQMAVDMNDQSYDPWMRSEFENPQLIEIFKNIELTPVENKPSTDSEIELSLFTSDYDNIIDGLPRFEITYEDSQFIVNSNFGQAVFESPELKSYLEGLFDDEKATKEMLSTIQESDVMKVHLSIGLEEVKTVEITDSQWIYELVHKLSLCDYTPSVTPESVSDLNAVIIYRQNNELKSLHLVKTGNSSAWIRYEGKFTEYHCPEVLEMLQQASQ